MLGKLLLAEAGNLQGSVKDNRACRSRALIDGKDVSRHCDLRSLRSVSGRRRLANAPRLAHPAAMHAQSGSDRVLIEAISAYKAKRYAEAEARIDTLLAWSKENAGALQLKALLARLRGDLQAAYVAAKASLALRPGHRPTRAIAADIGKALAAVGEKLRTQGEVDAAVVELRRALDLDSNSVVWFSLGLALQSRGDHAAAAEVFERAFELTPGDVRAMVNRGISLQQAGDLEGAWTCYRFAYRADPSTFAVISQALPAGDVGVLILDLKALRDRLSS
jgi:tetratricopeptide (TPR) repeat protein